ncbi:hypothetical protein D3C87_2009860 [compost metagenome]
MEWVVEIGALAQVAMLISTAAARSAAIIAQISTLGLEINAPLVMPLAIVVATLPPASTAPATSKTAARASPKPIVMARAPTAAPILLVTSFAPIFIAI